MSDAIARLNAALEGRYALRMVLVLAASACGGGDGEVPTSGDGTATEVAELVLELSIGDDVVAAPEYQFARIRSILITPDGTIWVADVTEGGLGGFARGTPLLRQYDAEGTFVRQVAREGDGPGEYRQPEGLVELPDGRVAVRDLAPPGKVILFTADGQVSETWTSYSLGAGLMRWTSGTGFALGVDGRGILWLPIMDFRLLVAFEPPPAQFLRIQPDGTVLDTVDLPSLPAVERDEIRMERRMRSGGRSTRTLGSLYEPFPVWAWSPMGTFAVARTDQYRIEVLPPPPAPDGAASTLRQATRVVQRDVPLVPVPQAEREAERDRMAQTISAFNPDSPVRVPDIPEYKPPIRRIDFADDGQLLVWVHMPSRLQDGEWTEAQAFEVFDLEGALLGRVVLPDSFIFHGMRGDMIWGVFRDPLEVQSVRLYTVSWS